MSQATSSRSILLPPSSSSTAMPLGSNTKPSWRLLTPGEVKKIMSGSNVNSAAPNTSTSSGYHHHHSHSQDDEHENGIHNHDYQHNHSHVKLNSTSTSALPLPLPLPLPMHSLGLDTTPLSTPTNDLEGGGDPLGSGYHNSGVVSGSGSGLGEGF